VGQLVGGVVVVVEGEEGWRGSIGGLQPILMTDRRVGEISNIDCRLARGPPNIASGAAVSSSRTNQQCAQMPSPGIP
jgi:hypothetical protein